MSIEITNILVDVWFQRLDTTVAEKRIESITEAYADARVREAIEADRKRRGEPVPKGWKLVPETPTSKQIVHMACQIKGVDADGWFRTDGDDWPEHVDAAERAYKWALSEAPQPAELGEGND